MQNPHPRFKHSCSHSLVHIDCESVTTFKLACWLISAKMPRFCKASSTKAISPRIVRKLQVMHADGPKGQTVSNKECNELWNGAGVFGLSNKIDQASALNYPPQINEQANFHGALFDLEARRPLSCQYSPSYLWLPIPRFCKMTCGDKISQYFTGYAYICWN